MSEIVNNVQEVAEQVLKTVSIKEFAKSKGFTQMNPAVAQNTSGYPYVTFIDKDNKAENIYFSKSAAEKVTAGTPVDKKLIADHQIAFVKNAAGEERIKLVGATRVELDSLFD